ncbi:MAG TPA: helix-turn-helix domain-containing protein [Solirubrobacterales bacterium]|nr:helix-turn-helix domain-containing protein [Solirubrobacterales bacterium]
MSANSSASETSLSDQVVAWLQERMPRGWEIEGAGQGAEAADLPADARITLRGPNGSLSTIVVEEKQVVSPRTVLSELSPRMQSARNLGAHLPLLVVTPWLSRRAQALLADEDISYVDLTGNALLRIDNPPFYFQTAGAERNPWPKERGRAQLRGAKAARLIRLLIDIRPPYGLQEIAEATGLAPGYVSRLLDTLNREALIERAPRGPVESVDIVALLRRWATSYDVFQANDGQGFIAIEGLERLLARAAADPAIGTRNTITGSFAAGRIAPVASPALLLVYSDVPALFATDLGLLPADEGADVMLLRPFDPVVFDRNQTDGGLRYAAPSQIAVDCLTGNGRMPAEGEALLDWMLDNEGAWRLDSLRALYAR